MPKRPLVRMDQIESKPTEWLWDGHLARGKVTLLEADSRCGKSTAVFDLVAELSRGERTEGKAVRTVLVVADHDAAEDIRPRLVAGGADLANVAAVGGLGLPALRADNPEDLADIEAALVELEADLLVIDPLVAFVGSGVNLRDDDSMRAAMLPILELARKHEIAVLVVVSSPDRGKRVGACGVFSFVLSLASILPEPEAEEEQAEAVGALDAAKMWLFEFLDGRRVPVREVLAGGELAGHTKRTIERARTELEVPSVARSTGGLREWLWVGDRA